MGLGKTISCVALIASTLQSARSFAAVPLEPPQPPPPPEAALSADHFAGSVWGMPSGSSESGMSAKNKAKAARQNDKLEAEYVRQYRLKVKSRATLIVCPLSTVVNWEEQFREHWKGEVEVFGGSGALCPSMAAPSAAATPSSSQSSASDVKPIIGRTREGTPLKVYVYHGNARKPDPAFLADFDAVITTYSTLAVEFSKQSKSLEGADEDEDEAGASSDGLVETDERGNQVIKLAKPKKAGAKKRKKACGSATEASSPLQSIYWFRVVLDEAQ